MSLPRVPLANRKFTVSIVLILLIAVFFTGYYFYFVPLNKERLHKDGFLILEDIKTSILHRNEDLQRLFGTYYARSQGSVAVIREQIRSNGGAGEPVIIRDLSASKNHLLFADTLRLKTANTGVFLNSIYDGSLVYLPANWSIDSVATVIPADSILHPILSSQRTELFGSYLLLNKNRIIYKDPRLGIAPFLSEDSSLLGKKEASFSGIRNVHFGDADYKMFYVPFKLGNAQVVLCGFVQADAYNKKLQSIPVSFVYPIVIVVLLLLVFLPLFKFFVMGRDEQVRFRDLSMSVVALFGGMTLLTLMIIQVLLLSAADIRTRENLDNLSSQIESAYTSELLQAYDQLDELDRHVQKVLESSPGVKVIGSKPLNLSREIQAHLGHLDTAPPKRGRYYNFDRVSWIDSSGQQVIKAHVGDTIPQFTNVADRMYVRVFRQGRPYQLPARQDSQFGFEPVNTWTNGEFSIIVSKRSRLQGFITTISTKMFSVIHTILPPGYGYCIIDGQGSVLLQSDMNRNLEENMLERTGQLRALKEALVGRQKVYLSEVQFYGKTNALSARPIAKTPLFLLVYYDRGYILPINMRILTFSVLFCFLSYLICALCWLVLRWKHYNTCPLLYPPLAFLRWAIPKRSASLFYTYGLLFLLGYLIVLLVSVAQAISSPKYYIDNFVLALALMSPVNVFSGLFIINRLTDNSDTEARPSPNTLRRLILFTIVLHLAISIAFYLAIRRGYQIDHYFLYVQGALAIFFLAFYVFYEKVLSNWRLPLNNHITRYAVFLTLIIITLAVMPAALYTFYAHNQELVQSVKKGQLYLASSLQRRQEVVRKFANDQRLPKTQYERLQYRTGIYRINGDKILLGQPIVMQVAGLDQFYFDIANRIGSNYYDPLLYPTLKDRADNDEWYWDYPGKVIDFSYAREPDNYADTAGRPALALRISSWLPERYKVLGFDIRGVMFFSFVALLILGLYALIRSLTQRMFLVKYRIVIDDLNPKPSILDYYARYNSRKSQPDNSLRAEIVDLEKEYAFYRPGRRDDIYKQEKQMVDTVKRLGDFYDFIWNNSNEHEKYMLMDMAKDGMMNFRNVPELYDLIEKGIVIVHNEEIKLFSPSFRAYILLQRNTPEMVQLHNKFQKNSSWQAFRIPLLILLSGIAVFIFLTQEETFQKMIAMIAGISSMASLLIKLFVEGQSKAAPKELK